MRHRIAAWMALLVLAGAAFAPGVAVAPGLLPGVQIRVDQGERQPAASGR